MQKKSAGLLVYRIRNGRPEFLLVHPGGPFWTNKDAHAWSIPKGEYGDDEEPLAAARREFAEETGLIAQGEFVSLTPVRQAGGKVVTAWAVQADLDVRATASNTFTMEWPPHSGRMKEFPEVDQAQWFTLEEARRRINKGQIALVRELAEKLTAKKE
ncbi:MAG: NUDIX domain-containing protein [Planctomycetaceae bacterium]|nr:NUDIX domain-containing protein [Planctomycetaceae bacterium]